MQEYVAPSALWTSLLYRQVALADLALLLGDRQASLSGSRQASLSGRLLGTEATRPRRAAAVAL